MAEKQPERKEPEGNDASEKREGLLHKTRLTDAKQYAVLGGEFRRGLKDMQDAVLQAFPDSAKSRDEPATVGNPTQAIVTSEIIGKEISSHQPRKEMTLEELRGYAQERAREANDRMEPSHEHQRGGREM